MEGIHDKLYLITICNTQYSRENIQALSDISLYERKRAKSYKTGEDI